MLRQPDAGYRFSIDPFLLAAFVRPRPRELVLEIGAGVGVVSLLLLRRNPLLHAVAVEIQPELAAMAAHNARASGLGNRVTVIEADFRGGAASLPAGGFSRVVANPPYRPPRAGRVSPDPARAAARQEISFTLADLCRTSARVLPERGFLDIVHLPERIPEIVRVLGAHRLELKTLRFVSPFPDAPPMLALLEARKGARPGLDVRPPLAVFDTPGRYSDEVRAALEA